MREDMPDSSEIILYQRKDGKTRLEVRFEGNTIWLSHKQLADLFQKDVRTINEHIRNIFQEQELLPEATIRKFRIVQMEGKRKINHPEACCRVVNSIRKIEKLKAGKPASKKTRDPV